MLALDAGDLLTGDASVASKLDYTIHGIVGVIATQLASGQLASSEGTLYTSPVDGVVVTTVTVVNTDTSARTCNLYLQPKGGTSRRIIAKNLSLGVAYSFHFDGADGVIFDPAGKIVYIYGPHAASHIDGTDDIQDAASDSSTKGISTFDAQHFTLTAGVVDLNIDDTPVNGETDEPITSNWAYDHVAAADPHAGYRLESADHTHASSGAQAGTIDHGAITGLTDDDHTQYLKEAVLTTKGDIYAASGASTPVRVGVGANDTVLTAASGETAGVKWATVSAGLAVFGDGSDGAVTISADAPLTRDMFYSSLTVDSTKTLTTAGFRIFVSGTLDNNGTISRNGNAGGNGGNSSAGTGGTAGTAGAALAAASIGASLVAGAGAAGGDGDGVGAAGNAGSNAANSLGAGAAASGAGGATTSPEAHDGGAAGGATTATAPAASEGSFRALHAAILLRLASAVTLVSGGAGGSGGGSGARTNNANNASGGGGGGGSGAGVLFIAAKTLDNSGGTISANGGAAGNAGTATVVQSGDEAVGGSGGGSGGGGGCLVLIYNSLSTGTETATGGAAGTGTAAATYGTGAAAAGVNGGAGSAGTVIKIANI